jgi:hypothetical protein
MTPDRSRAAALYVNKYPWDRPRVASGGWDALTPEEQAEAAEMFREEWGREMEEPV